MKKYSDMSEEEKDEADRKTIKGGLDDPIEEREKRAHEAYPKKNTMAQKLGDLKADRMTETARRRYRGNRP